MDDIYEDKQPKTKFGRFMKRFVAVILALLYVFFMFRIFMSCDSPISDRMILDRHLEEFRTRSMLGLTFPLINGQNRGLLGEDSPISSLAVYCYEPIITMDEEGRIQVKNIHYFRDARNFQLSVKINTDYYKVDRALEHYSFSLRKTSDGKVTNYPLSYRLSDERYGYVHFRLAFNGVEIAEGDELKLILSRKNIDGTESRVFSLKLVGLNEKDSEAEEWESGTTDTLKTDEENETEEDLKIYRKQLNPADLEYHEAIIR